jgi:hypothetical protein
VLARREFETQLDFTCGDPFITKDGLTANPDGPPVGASIYAVSRRPGTVAMRRNS